MVDVDGLDVSNGLPEEATPGPNQVLADRMGIVMGTSHQEPMARNTPEWGAYGNVGWLRIYIYFKPFGATLRRHVLTRPSTVVPTPPVGHLELVSVR
jgi:hypothetical protein